MHSVKPLKKLLALVVVSGCLLSSALAAGHKTATPEFKPTSVVTDGSVTVAGKRIDYRAVAGTLIVHARGWDDAVPAGAMDGDHENPTAVASMFYTAYFKK
ncbi:MAG TPA: peptidase S10, partial [Gammaproteobacteria bacterium]|nr:peptidase S10 [Gammaproteobacteria bacterium]